VAFNTAHTDPQDKARIALISDDQVAAPAEYEKWEIALSCPSDPSFHLITIPCVQKISGRSANS
jgi:hypothetical protein